jgi:hypothetical protein
MVSGQADAEADAPSSPCVHHWKLDRPIGAATRGCCKNCGEERDFQQVERDGRYPPRTVRSH